MVGRQRAERPAESLFHSAPVSPRNGWHLTLSRPRTHTWVRARPLTVARDSNNLCPNERHGRDSRLRIVRSLRDRSSGARADHALRIRRRPGGRSRRSTQHGVASTTCRDSTGRRADRRAGCRPSATPRAVGAGSARDKPADGPAALGRRTHAPFPGGRVPPVRRGHLSLSLDAPASSAPDFVSILPTRVGDIDRSVTSS